MRQLSVVIYFFFWYVGRKLRAFEFIAMSVSEL